MLGLYIAYHFIRKMYQFIPQVELAKWGHLNKDGTLNSIKLRMYWHQFILKDGDNISEILVYF